MRTAPMVVAGLACLALVAGSSATNYSDRELKDLAKRVSELEKQTADLQKALARLEKALSGIPKQAAATNRELARQVADLEKTVSALAKASSLSGRHADAVRKELKAVASRSDARTLLLAEWLDEYHPNKGWSHHHRNEIQRRK